jgi:prepilin-type N-terminal cleavage/methylation domain-containing protein
MHQSCQVLEKELLNPVFDRPQGFVLLEVLVAMSLILGSWMASVGTYQSLVLRATQMESKRTQLRREFDAFEVSEQARVIASTNIKGQNHESTRVSSRNHTKHAASEPPSKNKR